MKIHNLRLRQFRNLNKISLEFHKGLNIIVGDNGQGKTNLVESLVFLSSGRSFRVSDDQLLIQRDESFASIDAQLDSSNHLRVVISDKGKHMQINKNVIRRLSDFMGQCNVVLFSPDDLNFISDTPRRRRHDIDLELGKISSQYINDLSSYNKVLSERNAHLKSFSIDEDYLEILTQQLIKNEIPIIQTRSKFTKDIISYINKTYRLLTESNDSVSLEYKSPLSNDGDLEEGLRHRMKESLQRDIDTRMTNVGIHRDDFIFKINDEPVLHVASQGQRRMLMIAYKLALITLIHEQQAYYPILCLDDLFSELDSGRRENVLKMLPEAMQVFITTTDIDFIKTDREHFVFEVVDGAVSKHLGGTV